MSDTTLTNRAIAERAGWTDIIDVEDWVEYEDNWLKGKRLQRDIRENIPDYLDSTDAALTLPLAEGLFFVLMVNQHGATCSISPRLGVVEGDVEAADSAAAAVCAAWWAWMEAQADV